MGAYCPVSGPDDPLVHSLLSTVDCNVQNMVVSGYAALFQPSGAFASILTVLMTIYVAVIGYQLLLGRSQLNVTDFALTAVKLGAVVALATQWGAYQSLVYRFLFDGPQQMADVIVRDFGVTGASAAGGDVFDGLQRAFVDLTSFSPAAPPGAPANPVIAGAVNVAGAGPLSTLLSKAGFDSLLMLVSAVVLLVSSLGVLLASKIVLGLLLALGPIFIAMMLFESTRGLFEGWLRASLAFAFAPLTVTLMLALALTMLEPSLRQVESMRQSGAYIPGVAFAVMVLVTVFAGVALGIVAAAGFIAAGFKLPRVRARATPAPAPGQPVVIRNELAPPARAARTAAAVTAQERRDAVVLARGEAAAPTAASERHTVIGRAVERGPRVTAPETRLGQAGRRPASPRLARSGVRRQT